MWRWVVLNLYNITIVAFVATIIMLLIFFFAPVTWWGNPSLPGISQMEYIFGAIGGIFSLYALIVIANDRLSKKMSPVG